jgi:hypothetical protein
MLQEVFTGVIFKQDENYFIRYNLIKPRSLVVPQDDVVEQTIRVFPNGDFDELWLENNLCKTVDFVFDKKYLAHKTITYAKILPKKETWDDIVVKYKKDVYWNNSINESFLIWLKELYNVPIKK